MATTLLADLIDPEVMADSISAELPAKIAAKRFMKVNTDLVAKPGSTITVPRFNYIGPAADLAEGVEGSVDALTTNEHDYTVKKAVKNIELTDEAVLGGFGDPIGETTKQLRMSIQDKVDTDAIDLLQSDVGIYRFTTTSGVLSYDVVAEAMSAFTDEEQGIETYLLVSPEGMRQLRGDTKLMGNELISKDILTLGVVGSIAGAFIVISNKLNSSNDTRMAFLLKKEALTAFLKRDVNVETDRNVLSKKTLFSVDEHYVVGIEDANKVIGITHPNAYLGKESFFSKVTPGATTYGVVLSSFYPATFAANTLKYKVGTAAQALAFNATTASGWTTISGSSVTITGVSNSNNVITVAQILTADQKAKYYGFAKVL